MDKLKRDIYNAITDVLFKRAIEGDCFTKEEILEAIKFFEIHFFEDE